MIEAAEWNQQLSKEDGTGWTHSRQTLFRLCEYLRNCKHSPVAELTISENLAAPVVRFAWKEIRGSKQMELLSRNAASALRGSLRRRLAWIANQIVARELDRAFGCNLTKETGQDALIREFCSAGVAQKTLHLLNDYRVLARLWAVQVKWWQQFVSDFLGHSDAFIRHMKLGKNTRGKITAIKPDLSDPHNGGRTVMRVHFAKTTEWYYKPRTGCQEIEWFNLLRWLNAEGFALPFEIVDVKSEHSHCWMEAVRPKACRTQRELSRFYFRGGALSYLVHLLRGVDFHVGNLVAVSEQPVFVDIETLLHPATRLPIAARAKETSILRTGLFPVATRSTDSVSAFGQHGRRSQHSKLRLRPSVRFNCVSDLLAGFQAMHTFVAEKPARVRYFESMVARLAKGSGRNICRPTLEYFSALTQSFAPALMQDDLDRTLFLSAFCTENADSIAQVLAETAALEDADVPVFRSLRQKIRLDFSQETLIGSLSTIRDRFNVVNNAFSSAGA